MTVRVRGVEERRSGRFSHKNCRVVVWFEDKLRGENIEETGSLASPSALSFFEVE